MHRADLARGAKQLIVIPDESEGDAELEDWRSLAKNVDFAHLVLPVQEFSYHFRLTASIALAEMARQIGRRKRVPGARPERKPPRYRKELRATLEAAGELVYLDESFEY